MVGWGWAGGRRVMGSKVAALLSFRFQKLLTAFSKFAALLLFFVVVVFFFTRGEQLLKTK